MNVIKKPTQLTPVEKLSRESTVQALAIKKFDRVADLLPKKIEGTFELPKVREMILATSEKNVAGFVEFELIKLAERINVGGNLTPAQIEFIASQLIGMYPNETIADFKICFERGSIGAYGKIFKLDGIEIGGWMRAYLDEKYQVLESELMKGKDDLYKPVTSAALDPEAHQKWLDKLKEVTRPLDDKKIPPLTDKDIKLEGQEQPKQNFHPTTTPNQTRAHDLHLEYIRQNYDKYTAAKLPTWIPEQQWLAGLDNDEKK
jgi:hypothetical protein